MKTRLDFDCCASIFELLATVPIQKVGFRADSAQPAATSKSTIKHTTKNSPPSESHFLHDDRPVVRWICKNACLYVYLAVCTHVCV